MTTTLIRRALVAAGAVTLVVTAGCSSDTSWSDGSSEPITAEQGSADLPSDVSDTDVAFVRAMIPHHRQAVQMSELVIDNGDDPQVVALAQQIKDAQGPEIDQMTGWLADWNVDEGDGDNSSGMNGMNGMNGSDGMDGPGMTGGGDGMMSDSEMGVMTSTTGADLDRMYLEMMIRHHEGAIEMARTEVADGTNPAVQDLARRIIDGQEAEITRMQSMLGEDR